MDADNSAPADPSERTARTSAPGDSVEMPRPTAAPLVLSLGLALTACGVATSPALMVVGALIVLAGLTQWIGQLLPGRGHFHEPLVAPNERASAIVSQPGTVTRLSSIHPGYRLRLPEQVHPISAGVKGGIVGGVVMPLPALAWGYFSGHGIWYPVNLLAGMLLPIVDNPLDTRSLEQFSLRYLLVATVIHVTMSVVLGLLYGVLLPTLPDIPKALAWAGLLMPLLWTALSYLLMGTVNPLLREGVDWPWFVASQFVFGVVLALVVMAAKKRPGVVAGLLGGLVGGALMVIPAVAWSLAIGRGLWYPINLLAAMVIPRMDSLPLDELTQFHADWFTTAVAIHVAASATFGMALGLLLPRLRGIPSSLAWGGMLMPVLWTASSYSLMGVVNPVLQKKVDWPWFIVSQFVFGVAAAVVVDRSEKIYIPPAGAGPEPLAEYVEGSPS